MSNHLRHCPKHRKPLPCAHCAKAVTIVQPPTLPGFVSTSLPHEYERHKDVWVCIHCNRNDHSDTPNPGLCSKRNIAIVNKASTGKELDKKFAERERRAAKECARRKAKADQLVAIREALKTPVAEIMAAARAKADAERLPSMNEGRYMGDAPTGKGALVYKAAGKIDQIDAAMNRSVLLGSATIDDETGEAFFPDNDRERIAPDGVGAPSDEKPEITGLSRKGFTCGDRDEESKRKFQVKLDGPEYQSGLAAAVDEYSFQDGSETFCRLCEEQIFENIENHFTQVHGDPREPRHKKHCGDIVQKCVREFKRWHARLEKAGRDRALEVLADQKARAEIDAIQKGYVKLNGEWVLPNGTA